MSGGGITAFAASMDMFKDYKERGNKFAELVKSLS